MRDSASIASAARMPRAPGTPLRRTATAYPGWLGRRHPSCPPNLGPRSAWNRWPALGLVLARLASTDELIEQARFELGTGRRQNGDLVQEISQGLLGLGLGIAGQELLA